MRNLLLFLLCMGLAVGCADGDPSGFDEPSTDAGTPRVDRPDADPGSTGVVTSTGDDDDPGDVYVPPVPARDAAPPPAPDADPPIVDAADAGAIDAGVAAACSGPPGPGDLAIVELMIASVAGSGDHGEWIEIASTVDCALDLHGLHGDSPVGGKVASFDVFDHVWLPPRGSILVADSDDGAVNHDLPPLVVTWSGLTGDVLRNQGSTITIRWGQALVDSVTYPPLKLAPGTSLAFPSDCDADDRIDWTKWQPSAGSWFPAFHGTPNRPNDDVHCPAAP